MLCSLYLRTEGSVRYDGVHVKNRSNGDGERTDLHTLAGFGQVYLSLAFQKCLAIDFVLTTNDREKKKKNSLLTALAQVSPYLPLLEIASAVLYTQALEGGNVYSQCS